MTTFDEYQCEARRTQNPALALWEQRQHALYGLAAEVGEVLGLHQKVYQGHPMDDTALRLEIGDCLWFIAELCDCYGWHMSEIAGDNIRKLRVRYKDRFTQEESRARVDTLKNGRVYKAKRKPVRSRYYSSVKEGKA